MALTVTDVFLICGYAALIAVYAQALNTRESIAAVAGYTALLVGKRFEYSHGKDHTLTKRVKQLGYSILFASPSYSHWYDLFAVVGYTYCVFGMFDEATPPLALYYIMGAEKSTSYVPMVARAILGPAIIMGYKSPLQ
jgi:hypothetical protein